MRGWPACWDRHASEHGDRTQLKNGSTGADHEGAEEERDGEVRALAGLKM